jgi:hypothetical protein
LINLNYEIVVMVPIKTEEKIWIKKLHHQKRKRQRK